MYGEVEIRIGVTLGASNVDGARGVTGIWSVYGGNGPGYTIDVHAGLAYTKKLLTIPIPCFDGPIYQILVR